WYAVFAAIYYAIEEWFKLLGIYEQHWYKSWMTVLLLFLIFWIAKKSYAACTPQIGRKTRYFFIYLGLVTLHQHLVVWAMRLAGIRVFSETILPEKERSLVVLSAAYMVLLGVSIMVVYFAKIKWSWKLAMIAVLYVAHYVASMFELIIYKE